MLSMAASPSSSGRSLPLRSGRRHRHDVARRIGGELRGVYGLERSRADAEGAGHVGAQAVLEGVLAGRQPVEEEVVAAVPRLLVTAGRGPVPDIAGAGAVGLQAGRSRIAQMDVLGRCAAGDGELNLHF